MIKAQNEEKVSQADYEVNDNTGVIAMIDLRITELQ